MGLRKAYRYGKINPPFVKINLWPYSCNKTDGGFKNERYKKLSTSKMEMSVTYGIVYINLNKAEAYIYQNEKLCFKLSFLIREYVLYIYDIAGIVKSNRTVKSSEYREGVFYKLS